MPNVGYNGEMSDVSNEQTPTAPDTGASEVIEANEVTTPEDRASGSEADPPPGSVSEPAKVMRIGSMIKQLLEEVRTTDLDERGRHRLREIYDSSVSELSGALSPDLREELVSLAMPFGDDELPSESELRIAQAQLVGWLEGLFHGIQATLFAQQMAAQQQLEQIKHAQALPPGASGNQGGVYL